MRDLIDALQDLVARPQNPDAVNLLARAVIAIHQRQDELEEQLRRASGLLERDRMLADPSDL